MRFKLGGISYFLTKKEFDTLFGFKSEGEIGLNTLWSPHNFWIQNIKPNTSNFHVDHSKSSSFFFETLMVYS